MKQEEADYVRLRVQRARDSLREAQLLLNNGYLRGTVNRTYYACFYAANAILFSEGLSSSKHSGVMSLFERHWIKTGRLPVEMGKYYRQLFERRQEGDYEDTAKFEKDEVEKCLAEAHLFVERIADWLRANAGVEA